MRDWLDDIRELKLPTLAYGPHSPGVGGSLCAMEMVAFMERLPHTDSPECTCPVIAGYVRTLNDLLDGERQRLLPYLPHLVGTVSREHEASRAHVLQEQVPLLRSFAARLDDPLARKLAQNFISMAYETFHQGGYESCGTYFAAALPHVFGHDTKVIADLALPLLDEMLAIGPQGKFSHPERVLELERNYGG